MTALPIARSNRLDTTQARESLVGPTLRLCLALSLCLFFLATVCSAVIVK